MPINKKIVELDCGKYPEIIGTSLKIRGTKKEVLETALKIAVEVNGHQNTQELRRQVNLIIKNSNK